MAGVRTRFAPSPTGPLHLGHAYSAWVAYEFAKQHGGEFLLRLEDIDRARCKPEFEAGILDDLDWLGLSWPSPVLRQSTRTSAYQDALRRLEAMGVTYRCACRRADIRAALSAPQEGALHAGAHGNSNPVHTSPIPIGPDGPVYPGTCRHLGIRDPDTAIRLNMRRAVELIGAIEFTEIGPVHTGVKSLDPTWMIEQVGDVVLGRRDIGVSYHLAVCVDDAFQDITHVVRGVDLFEATAIHCVLQSLLNLPRPEYFHHALVRDETGKRLAKRDDARAIFEFRKDQISPADLISLAKAQL